MHAEPPAITHDKPLAPPALDRIVRTCLAKDPDDRWQSARDLQRELQWVRQAPRAAADPSGKRGAALAVAAAALTLALVTAAVWQLGRSESTGPVVRFPIDPPPGTSLPVRTQPYSPAISPDGTQVVFRIVRDNQPLLAVRFLESLESQVLSGTDNGRWPFWSPDSRSVAFFAGGQLKKLNVAGGPVRTICDVPDGWGGTWSRDGLIVFLRSETEGFYQVPASGGVPAPAISLPTDQRFNGRPQFLPDGRRFLYGVSPDEVHLASLDDGSSRRVLKGTSMAAYAPTGHLFFYQGSALVAQRFDVDLTRALEEPAQLGEGFGGPIFGAGGLAFSVSNNGVVAYKSTHTETMPDSIGRFDRSGKLLEQLGPFPFEGFAGVRVSPDGGHLVMQSPAGQSRRPDIWTFDLVRRQATQVTFADGADRAPVWSPDGKRVVFASLRPEAPGMYVKTIDGDAPEELVMSSDLRDWEEYWPLDWSSEGILFERGRNREGIDLWMFPIDGARQAYPVVREPGTQNNGRISPGGKWLAYTQRDGSSPGIYVQSLTSPKSAKRRISSGAFRPLWRRDGKELFYLTDDGNLVAVPVEGEGTNLQPGVPQILFQTGILSGQGGGGLLGVSPDGRQFVIRMADERDKPASLIVLSNWPAALKDRDDRR
jgi:Tol biopolymer transport system component